MILRNFTNMLVAYVTGSGVPVVNYTGAEQTYYHNQSVSSAGKPVLYDRQYPNNTGNPTMTYILTSEPNTSYGGVLFGTGNTPPTYDDYKLSGSMITGLTITKSESADSDESGGSRTVTYTITNGGTDPVTIGEIGLIAVGCVSPTDSSYYARYPMLVERTALDSPVTIPAGGIGQVVYTIHMNYPT